MRNSLLKTDTSAAIIVFLVSLLFFWSAIFFLDNTNINTTNGLWKSQCVKGWSESPPKRHFDAANLIYFPVYGYGVRALPEAMFGQVWKRMSLLNSIFAAFGLAWLYVMLRTLELSRVAAISGVLFQLGCAFFLIDAIISEDIMPAIGFLLASFSILILNAKKKSTWGIVFSGLSFAAAWLFHWHLLLVSVAPFALALLVGSKGFTERVGRIVLFFSPTILVPILVGLMPGGKFIARVQTVLFPGKGMNTGYGGFSIPKLGFMSEGITEYLSTGKNLSDLSIIFQKSYLLAMIGKWVIILILAYVFIRKAKASWSTATWRVATVLLAANFIFNEFFNLYVQPQDPQMQLSPMIWLSVAWAILCGEILILNRARLAQIKYFMVILSLIPLAWNSYNLLPFRGQDSRALAEIKSLQALADPKRTVFCSLGFERIDAWLSAYWGSGDYPPQLQTPPQSEPGYKPIYLIDEATSHPKRSAADSACRMVNRINEALDKGFEVIIDKTWSMTEAEFVNKFSTVSGKEKPRAIYSSLKKNFYGKRIGLASDTGVWYELYKRGRKSE